MRIRKRETCSRNLGEFGRRRSDQAWSSCPNSQARAYAQCRSAVAREMPRHSAASSRLTAGEEAQLDQLAAFADAARPASPAPRPGPAGRSDRRRRRRRDRASRCVRPSPPRFRLRLARAPVDEDAPHGLGRGGEEVAAAVPVLAPGRRHVPTSRRYASWTRAVACSVCPGFSWASFCAASLRSSS